MRTGGVWLLAALAAGCGKKVEATPLADAASKETPGSCLRARDARMYVWQTEPLELALDVELDWTCPVLAEDKLELTDTDVGAKFGDQKVKERYRVDKSGALAEWDDPFLYGKKPLHGLFLYSVPTKPSAVALSYGGVQILASIPVGADHAQRPPSPAMRIVSTSTEPSEEKGKNRITVLIELTHVPRSVGRDWKVPEAHVRRQLLFKMTGEKHKSWTDADWIDADRVMEVDEKLVPAGAPLPTLPVRPAKRFLLAQVSLTKMKRLEEVSASFSDGRVMATADGATKLLVPKETRARFDVAPPSADVETSKL